ncbi:hypothetical protein Bbelb_271440 [Branchiostoma belcheri]|nr:hypothetical protein Bbelb_271440 [Branchiostoma belcheri]
MAEAMEKAVEGVNLHIPGRCKEDDGRDDAAKNGSDTGGDSSIQQSADFDVFTQLYGNEDSCTQLYANEHSCIQLYASEDSCIQPYASEDACIRPYASEDACIQPYADAYQKHGEDDKGSHLATAHGTTVGEASPMTRSDSVGETSPTTPSDSGEDDIQPYTVGHERDDNNDANDDDDTTAERGELAAGNRPNTEGRWIQVLVVVVTVGMIVSLIVGGIFAVKASMGGPQLGTRSVACQDSNPGPLGSESSTLPSKQTVENVPATGFSGCCTFAETSMTAGAPTLSASTQSSQARKQTREFRNNYGVAVSADNEIFVTDYFNNRVQVFSINGTYLRLFPTVVPGESSRMPMYPSSVASDVNPEYLWVLGFPTPVQVNGHVVLYSRNGRPIKKFDVRFLDRNQHQYPVIAMDTRNNKVIVMDRDTIRLFHPNGTLYRSILYRSINTKAPITMGVTSDREGNILLNDGFKTIMVYNTSGEKIFQFGTFGRNMGQLNSPIGICMGASGHIIVANSRNNRVDMFGRSGEFVRTIGNVIKPWGIAIGPDGDVVVTSPRCRGGPDVSIFPGHVVFL